MRRVLVTCAVMFLMSAPALATDITECQTFTTAGTYVLQNDVTSNGTCFSIAASNVILDLNGHTVTYDNALPITVPNSGFEDALAGSWDVSSAPNATRMAGEIMEGTLFSGDYGLRFSTPCADQSVVSVGDVTLQPNTKYSLSGMYYNQVADGNNIVLSLDGTSTNATLTGRTWRGFQYFFVQFTTGSTEETHKIRISVDGLSSASSGYVFVDDIKIQQSAHYGVHLGSDNARYGLTVKNGSIIQGQARGDFSFAVRADINPYLEQVARYENLNIYTWGNSCFGLYANYLSNSQVLNCTFDTDTEVIWRRDYLEGYVIKSNWASWGGLIANNTILNSAQGGITAASSDSDDPMIISGNTIYLDAKYTNAFGIGASGIIANNTVDTISNDGSGRGIMYNGDSGADIYGNTISVKHKANNQEYKGCPGEAYGYQNEKEAKNGKFHDNTVNVLADECGAIGYMFWGPEADTAMGNEIYNNVFNATVKVGSTQRAAVLRLFERYEETARSIYNNVFKTNGHFLWFMSPQTAIVHLDRNLRLDGNTFEVLTPLADTFRAIISSTNSESDSPRNVSIVNNVYADETTRAALEDYPIYSLYASGEDTHAYNIVLSGDDPTPDPTCDINNLNLCDQPGCEALGKYWYDGTCNANAEPVDPDEPTTGPILRIGDALLNVGGRVLRVQ